MMLAAVDIGVRDQINRFFVAAGAAPRAQDLADRCGITPASVQASLERLETAGHLLLYPHRRSIWVAHPFSAIPSNYWVSSNDHGWWGNCGFCSLGIAAMTGSKARIYTRLGAEQQAVELRVDGDHISPTPLWLHLPLPVHNWHDEIVATCGQVHFFEAAAAIDGWCVRHRVPRGQALPVATAWTLARRWYGRFLDRGWRPRSNAQLNALLRECNLHGAFWRLPAFEPADSQHEQDT